MEAKNMTSLFDISIWDHNSWHDWKGLPLPNDLRDLWTDLETSLSGSAPTNKVADHRYIWDPSGGNITIKEGYKLLQANTTTGKRNIYVAVWNSECFPKIKFFNWTFLKGKILTAENIRKKGILGPSIYCLCRAVDERSHHLFFDYPFTQSYWTQLISPLKIGETFDQLPSLQKNWEKCYPFPKKNKNSIIRLWKCIPTMLSWKIWLTGNNYIFNNQKPNPARILEKTMALISNTISANSVFLPDRSSWHKDENDWFKKFCLSYAKHKQTHPKAEKIRNNWELRGTNEDIRQWILDQN